jgi:hypothetical protein
MGTLLYDAGLYDAGRLFFDVDSLDRIWVRF